MAACSFVLCRNTHGISYGKMQISGKAALCKNREVIRQECLDIK